MRLASPFLALVGHELHCFQPSATVSLGRPLKFLHVGGPRKTRFMPAAHPRGCDSQQFCFLTRAQRPTPHVCPGTINASLLKPMSSVRSWIRARLWTTLSSIAFAGLRVTFSGVLLMCGCNQTLVACRDKVGQETELIHRKTSSLSSSFLTPSLLSRSPSRGPRWRAF